jgi:hypothetical protein
MNSESLWLLLAHNRRKVDGISEPSPLTIRPLYDAVQSHTVVKEFRAEGHVDRQFTQYIVRPSLDCQQIQEWGGETPDPTETPLGSVS